MENSVKSKSTLKMKDRKPYSQNENSIGKINKSQNEIPQQFHFENFHNSPIKKALNEMNAIVKIGVEKDFSLYEKNSMILNSNETIDNLRKNVLHLQMEYEKLDQNFQKEISQRSEICQRMDATKNLVESVLHSATHLGNSIKQLENDKLNLAEFYELVYQTQKEAEKKYETVEKLVKEQDILVKTRFEEISRVQKEAFSKNAASLSEINGILTQTKEKLKTTLSENEKLILRVEGLACVTKNLDFSVRNKQEMLRVQTEKNFKLQSKLKNFKILKNKYSNSSKNMKKRILVLKQKNNQLAKLASQTENSYKNTLVNNENIKIENDELKLKIENILKSMEIKKQKLETQNNELLHKISTIELENRDLHNFNAKMIEKINELDTKYEIEKNNRNEIEEKYVEITKQNEQFQLIIEDLNKENDKKNVTISELKEEVLKWENSFNSDREIYKNELKNSQNLIKECKEKISDLEEKLSFTNTARQNILLDYNAKVTDNQKLMEKIDHLTKDLVQSTDKIEILQAENSEKCVSITTLESQINALKSIISDKEKDVHKLEEELENAKLKISHNRGLQMEFDRVKAQNLNLNEKIVKEQSLTLTIKNNLEKEIKTLKEELKADKILQEEFKEIKKKLEKEKTEMKKVLEENLKLKDSLKNLKNRFEEAEAKIEAYKVVVKKLETEKTDGEENHSLEISRQKLEITRLQETETANEGPSILEKVSRNCNNNQSFLSTPNKNINISPRLDNKKVATSTPKSTSNKMIFSTPQSTPRKIFTSKSGSQSTPKKTFPAANSSSNAQTPKKIIKDPYNFDSDDSSENFDPKQVLRLFGPRQKKEYDRKSKGKK